MIRKRGPYANNVKKYCIFITEEKHTDGSTLTQIEEVGDEELREELRYQIAQEALEELRPKSKR